MKNILKKYGKMVAAAVFLTVAGLCYGFAESRDNTVILTEEAKESVKETELQEQETAANILETAEKEAAECYVHICGEVNEPGVYTMPEGSRIFEVVEAAGGLTENAAEESLNLASVISDGMQIVIISKEEAISRLEAEAAISAGIVNINQASKEQLMTLTGIGESRAEDILRYRKEHGSFQTIEEIMKVPGIKDAAFQKIKDSIGV